MKKRTSKAFGKKVYLLGENIDGQKLWLEQATWDCDWYWGFGYIETYTDNNRPAHARDITSHSHYSSKVFNKGIHHINQIEGFKSVLTDKDAWELSDLMQSFYTLSGTAEIYHQGNSHYTSTKKVNLKDESAYNRINKEILPKIFNRIYEMLDPKGGKK